MVLCMQLLKLNKNKIPDMIRQYLLPLTTVITTEVTLFTEYGRRVTIVTNIRKNLFNPEIREFHTKIVEIFVEFEHFFSS